MGLDVTLTNARAIVGLSGRAVPVVAGADRPLLGRFEDAAHVHGGDGLGGVKLPPGPAAAPGLAVDRIRAELRAAAPDSVTLVGLGPATNLGLALAAEPALADRVAEIVLMTGACGEGNVTPSAEFNAYNDPEALAVVLGCGRPVTLATLDVTNQALCRPSHIAALRASGAGACLRATADIWDSVPVSRRSGGQGHEQHDACAVAWLVAPSLFTHRAVHAAVECGSGAGRGRTIIDRWGMTGAGAECASAGDHRRGGFLRAAQPAPRAPAVAISRTRGPCRRLVTTAPNRASRRARSSTIRRTCAANAGVYRL